MLYIIVINCIEDAQRQLPVHKNKHEGVKWQTKLFESSEGSNPITGEETQVWAFKNIKLDPYEEEEPRTFIYLGRQMGWEGTTDGSKGSTYGWWDAQENAENKEE